MIMTTKLVSQGHGERSSSLARWFGLEDPHTDSSADAIKWAVWRDSRKDRPDGFVGWVSQTVFSGINAYTRWR